MKTLDILLARLRMRQLQLLIALDEHKSMHKAAGDMAITQSAASKALRELELMFGAPLFERTRNGMIPNQLGHCVIRYARTLTMDLSAMCDDLSEIRQGRGGRLAVGAIMGALPNLVLPAIKQILAEDRRLIIEVTEDTSLKMLAQLDEGQLDLIIARSAVSDQPENYTYEKLSDEPLSIVVGFNHPDLPKKVNLKDFVSYCWVVYPTNMPMRTLLEREMDINGLSLPSNIITTASTFVTITALLQDPNLIAILPTSVARVFVQHKILRIAPVKLQSKSQSFGIVTRKNGIVAAPAQRFISIVKNLALDLPE